MTKKLIFGKNNKGNSYSKNSLNNVQVAKNSTFQSTKNSKNFNYHQRLPFKLANIELKYIRNIVAFVGVTVTLLLVLQSLTAYSSNFDPKIQTVRLITNFNQNQKQNQKNSQSQTNIIQEFDQGNSFKNQETKEDLVNKKPITKKSEDVKNSKNTKKSAEKSSQKIRIKKNQKSENNSQESNKNSISQQEEFTNSDNLEE